MALNAYLTLMGEVSGLIEGGVTQAGREGTIAVNALVHSVTSPRDAASGLPTGRRQHKPFTITKEIDKASPQLMNAMIGNENLTFRLEMWRPSPTGAEEQFYTVELTNATISDIRTEQLNNKYPENVQHAVREHISLTYQRISWLFVEGGIRATDDWGRPSV